MTEIAEDRYKDIPCLRMENAALRVKVIPRQGGKIASIYSKRRDREWLVQAPGKRYRPLGLDTSYTQAECSGFDDLFPTVDACEMAGAPYRDHGEACRLPWPAEIFDGGCRLHVTGRDFPYELSKQIELTHGGLRIQYALRGELSKHPYLWAGHCMLRARPGGVLTTSFADRTRMMFCDGADAPLSHSGRAQDTWVLDEKRVNYKFYFENRHADYAVRYREGDDPGIEMRVTGDCGWLGVWINQGVFKREYCLAFEPATAPFDRPPDGKSAAGADSTNWALQFIVK